ncbi:BMP family ABC transporter substrate-binding protein [Mycoplasma hafezii]|uniref:BMP family ABC transporter substrate-binding protein n=1 Tax=Mycoplasma hafezii TaxID=525886 RepID=UPI003CF8470B
MKKIKNLFFALSSVTAMAALPMVAVSCVDPSESEGTKPNKYIEPKNRLAVLTPDTQFNKAYVQDNFKNQKFEIALVTDAGNVDDKSFNQSSWEALNQIWDQTEGLVKVKQLKPQGTNYAAIYSQLLTKGTKVWILSGFKHQDPITKFIAANKAQMDKKGIIIIGVDFVLPFEGKDAVQYDRFYGLGFKVQQSAYVVGKAVSKTIAEEFKENPEKRIINSFGGGSFPGVTDFNIGFLRGILAYNTANAEAKVKTNTNNLVPIDSGFEPNDKMKQVINSIIAQNPAVTLPVAGPATQITIEELDKDSKYKDVKIIGVDVDQALTFSAGSSARERFLSSITKNIAQATYDIILARIFNLDPKGLLKGVQGSLNLSEGMAEGWVGYTNAYVKDETLKANMDKNLAEAKADFDKLTPEQVNDLTSLTVNGQTEKGIQEALNALAKLINA